MKSVKEPKEVLKKDLIANSLYNNENLKTKIKFHERKTFCTIKKFLKNFHCIFLSMILSDSVFKKIKKILATRILKILEECKYISQEKKMHRYITNDLKISSDHYDRE